MHMLKAKCFTAANKPETKLKKTVIHKIITNNAQRQLSLLIEKRSH